MESEGRRCKLDGGVSGIERKLVALARLMEKESGSEANLVEEVQKLYGVKRRERLPRKHLLVMLRVKPRFKFEAGGLIA